MLAAISLPPLTDDANRHRPSRQPSRQARRPRRTRAGSRPARTGPPQQAARSPPRPARPPAPRTRPRAPPARPRTAAPSRAPSYAARRPAPPPAGPRTRRRPPASITAPTVSASSSRQASTNAGSSAWLTRHGPQRTRGTKIFRQRPAAPGHAASNQTRTSAARRTTGSPGGAPPPRGQPPHTHRPAAGTAIRWPRATHRLGSLPAIGANEARRDPSRPAQTAKSWPAQRQPGGDIVKEHGQTRGRDAQEIRPSTPLQAVARPRHVRTGDSGAEAPGREHRS